MGYLKKEAASLKLEQNKLAVLAKIKSKGGPFTSSEEVDSYMDQLTDDKIGQQRMREEMTYARDSSQSIPRTSPLFKIMTRDALTGKNRLKTASEFAQAMRMLLGKQEENTVNITNIDIERAVLES